MVSRLALPLATLLAACHAALPLEPPPGDIGVGPDRAILDASADLMADGPAIDLTRDLSSDLTGEDSGCVGGCRATPCEEATCVAGVCVLTPRAEGDVCQVPTSDTTLSGTCHVDAKGTLDCCTDCWDQATKTCLPGTATTQCGTGGEPCASCPGATCETPLCVNQACVKKPVADLTPCFGGMCYSGACCQGCWDGSQCLAGTNVAACGQYGEVCLPCPTGPCTVATCPGSCDISWAPEGTACPGGSCHSGDCCQGCWDAKSSYCHAGTTLSACGTGGVPCATCGAGQVCDTSSGSCVAP